MRALIYQFVEKLPLHLRQLSPFKNNLPGYRFVAGFLSRNKEVKLKRRDAPEQALHPALSQSVLAAHLARLKNIYSTFGLTSPKQIFNMDESAVSTRSARRGKYKAALNASRRQNYITMKFSSIADHVTIMPVVSACGKVWNTVVILRGVCQKFRTRSVGTTEMPHKFLPHNSFVAYRSPANINLYSFSMGGANFSGD